MDRRFLLPLPWVLAGLGLVGCREDKPRAYVAPPDPPLAVDPAAANSAGGSPSGTARPASAGASRRQESAPWTVPAGWTEKPDPAGVRQASYGVTRGERSLDIAVTAFPGDTGSELANVNRWRRELALPEVGEEALKGLGDPVRIGGETGRLYEFVNTEARSDGKPKERTLVAQLAAGGMNVFFKLRGEATLAAEERANYLAWLASVQTGPAPAANDAPPAPSAAPAAPAAPAAAPSTAGAPPADMRGPVSAPPPTDLPRWSPPAHWQAAGQKPMRLASFDIPGAGGAKGDLSISALGGGAGGLLANVNRWRGQVGLAPWDEAALAKAGETLALDGGPGTLVDLKGAEKRILAVIVPRGDRTWFYKLTAPDALVGQERDNFVKFVQSVRY